MSYRAQQMSVTTIHRYILFSVRCRNFYNTFCRRIIQNLLYGKQSFRVQPESKGWHQSRTGFWHFCSLIRYLSISLPQHSTEVTFALLDPAAPGSFLSICKKFDFAEIYCQCCFDSGQRIDNVHLELELLPIQCYKKGFDRQ